MISKKLRYFFLLAAFTHVSAFTFQLIEKPGAEHTTRAIEARDAGNEAEAIAAFQTAIDKAIDHNTKAQAMAHMASLYLEKEVVIQQEADKAMELLHKAEKLGYPRAKLLLGDVYFYGQGTPVDYPKAYEYYTQIEDQYAGALVSLAHMVDNPLKASDYMSRAAEKLEAEFDPSIETSLRIARVFRDGKVVSADQNRAEYWYQRSVEGESINAINELADMWSESNHQPFTDVIALWQRAADLGNDESALKLGYAYANGNGVSRDADLSSRYFEKAVQMNPNNAYRIGRWYDLQSETSPAYGDVAFDWYRVAAVKGHPEAILRQARAYWFGERVPMDRARAEKLYRLSAQQGSTVALAEFSDRQLREATKVKERAAKEKRQAVEKAQRERKRAIQKARKRKGGLEFWLPLAKGRDAEAMLRVGEIYLQGNGVDRDVAKGVEWLTKAANRGNGEAMYSLAQIHSTGMGVPMALDKAYGWYKKSANVGHAAGQYQLGLSYARGMGTTKDIAKARLWLKKARTGGYSQADNILKNLTEE